MCSSVLGAKNAAMTRSAAVASQMGRKRAATRAPATTCAERPIVAASATRSPSPGELTDRPIESGRMVKGEPRPGVHSAHLEREVSTMTERTRRSIHAFEPAEPQGTTRQSTSTWANLGSGAVDSRVLGCLCSLYIWQRDAACRRRVRVSADAISMSRRPRRVA